MSLSNWAACACATCVADGNAPMRASVGYDYAHFCTSHPTFVSVCEWAEELSGEECKPLSDAVANGLVKRGQLAYFQARDAAFTKACEEHGPCNYESFIAAYPAF